MSRRLLLAFLAAITIVAAQDSTSYWTSDVKRVGQRLACRCGGCRNTVGDCPMLHCGSADPKRHRIYEMKQTGAGDDDIVRTIVREEGIIALATPPSGGFWPVLTWVMPGIALLLGFLFYSWYVKRNRKAPETLTAADEALIHRFQAQIDHELE